MNYGNFFEELLKSGKNFNAYGISFQGGYDNSYSFSFLPTALWKYLYFAYLPFEERVGDVFNGMLLLDRNIEIEAIGRQWGMMLDRMNGKETKLGHSLMSKNNDRLARTHNALLTDKSKLSEIFNVLHATKMKEVQNELLKQAIKTEGAFSLPLMGTLELDRIKACMGYVNSTGLPMLVINRVLYISRMLELGKLNFAHVDKGIDGIEKSNAELIVQRIKWQNLFRGLQEILLTHIEKSGRLKVTEIMEDALISGLSATVDGVVLNEFLEYLNGATASNTEIFVPTTNMELGAYPEKEMGTLLGLENPGEIIKHLQYIGKGLLGSSELKNAHIEHENYTGSCNMREAKLSVIGWVERALYQLIVDDISYGLEGESEATLIKDMYSLQAEGEEFILSTYTGISKSERELALGDIDVGTIEQWVDAITELLILDSGTDREIKLDRLIDSYMSTIREILKTHQVSAELRYTRQVFTGREMMGLYRKFKDSTVPQGLDRYLKFGKEFTIQKYLHSATVLMRETIINLPPSKLAKSLKDMSVLQSGVLSTEVKSIFQELLARSYMLSKEQKGIINSKIAGYDFSNKMPYIIRGMLTGDTEIKKFTQAKPFELLDKTLRQLIAQEGLKDSSTVEQKELFIDYSMYHLDDKLKKEIARLDLEYQSDSKDRDALLQEFLMEFERQMVEMRIVNRLHQLTRKEKDSVCIKDPVELEKQSRDIDLIRDSNRVLKSWRKLYIMHIGAQFRQLTQIDRTHIGHADRGPRELLNLVILLQLNQKLREADGGGRLITVVDDGEYLIDLIEMQERLDKLDKPAPQIRNLIHGIEVEEKELLRLSIDKLLQGSKERLTFVDKIYQLSDDKRELVSVFHELLLERDGTEELYQLGQELVEKIKNGLTLDDAELDKLKEVTVEIGFLFDEMYRRWYFMPSDGPYDDPLVPNENWDYINNPINGFMEDPLPGKEEGRGRVLVDLDILKNVIDFMELLFRTNLSGYAGCTPEQAIKHFITAMFDWLDHQIPDTEDKIPEFYPDDYDRYNNPNMEGRQDYWKIFRHVRWYSEGILNNITESEKTGLKGAKYVRSIIDKMIEYYKSHHSDEDLKLDKFKGFRRRSIQKSNKLLKKEEI
jgi:hypothetical protein